MGVLPGTLAGLAAWLSLALKSAFAMIGIGAFAQLIWPDSDLSQDQWAWMIKGVAIACCAGFMVLNIVSVKVTGRIRIVMVSGLLVVLVVFIVSGLLSPQFKQHPNYDNFLACGFDNVFATAALVFVSFGGLTKVASIGEEIRKPGRNIPRAMMLAYVTVSVLYILTIFVLVGVVDGDTLRAGPNGNMTPLSTAAANIMGPGGLVLLSGAAILAFVTTGNSGILAASRSPMAMSRDSFLPGAFGRVSKRFGTPHVSIVVTAVFIMAMIAFLSIGNLIKVASTMKLILFLLMNVAVLVMRGSRLQNYRPRYRSPLFPWVQLVGVGLYVTLIVVLTAKLGPAPMLTVGGFILAGVLWYVVYVRPRVTRESALVYMVRNVVASEIRRSGLEEELREIALERDEIVQDRFDRMVQQCEILDLPGPVSVETMFTEAADLLARRLNVPRKILLDRFRARESDSSTIIQPGLAIPHIIVDGQGLFDVLLVRSREGIVFDPERPYVKTAFILIGSADERNYHLRALMAIAQIVQEEGFTERWLAAPGPEHLRDLVLLSRRCRDEHP